MNEPWREFNVDELFAQLAEDGIQEATEHPNPKHAYSEIGQQYMMLQQHDKAMAWFRQAADRNSSSGNYHIGRAYQFGLGVPKDPYSAVDWYIKAAKQKYKDAYVAIAHMLGNGIGVPVNKYLALEWLYKSERNNLINVMQAQMAELKYVDKSMLLMMMLLACNLFTDKPNHLDKNVAQLVNETEAIYRAQRDMTTDVLMQNISKLNKEMDSNKAIIKEKDNQIEALKREIQKLDPLYSEKDEYHDLTFQYQQSKHTVELLEKKFWNAEQRLKSLEEEYQELYKDGLHIDDQNELLKDATEALKRQLKDPDNIVVSLQLEKKKLLRAKRNDITANDTLEKTLRALVQAEDEQLQVLKKNSELDLNIAKLRNDTLASVNRKLKYRMGTRHVNVPESIHIETMSNATIGVKREYSEMDGRCGLYNKVEKTA